MLRRILIALLIAAVACPAVPVAQAECAAARVQVVADGPAGSRQPQGGHGEAGQADESLDAASIAVASASHCGHATVSAPRPRTDGCDCCRGPGPAQCEHGPALAGGCACLERGEADEQPPAAVVASFEAPAHAVSLTYLCAEASTPRRRFRAPVTPASLAGAARRTARPLLCSWTI